MIALASEPATATVMRPPRLIRTILLATDLSPSATSAALCAMELASQLGAQLVVASVIDREGPTVVSAGEEERADLIAIGTRGREGMTRGLLGSVPDHIVRHGLCPVLVVRSSSDID